MAHNEENEACDNYFDCTNNNISPEDALRLLIRTDSNGCPALAVKTVTAMDSSCDTFVACESHELSWKDLFFLIVGKDANGCPVIRVIE